MKDFVEELKSLVDGSTQLRMTTDQSKLSNGANSGNRAKLPIYRNQSVSSGKKDTNCWEFKKCGREKGGEKAKEFGVCPAYPHHGKQCASLTGTLCGGKVQGIFAMKANNCMQCDFYKSPHYDKRSSGGAKAIGRSQTTSSSVFSQDAANF